MLKPKARAQEFSAEYTRGWEPTTLPVKVGAAESVCDISVPSQATPSWWAHTHFNWEPATGSQWNIPSQPGKAARWVNTSVLPDALVWFQVIPARRQLCGISLLRLDPLPVPAVSHFLRTSPFPTVWLLGCHSLCLYVGYSATQCLRSGRRKRDRRAPRVVGLLHRGAKLFIAQASRLDFKHYSNQKFTFQAFNLSPVTKSSSGP